jgi:pyruvate/2-oxoglutarate dehydrogenase complex dihydrolipoamide acyltransferase (E2) component
LEDQKAYLSELFARIPEAVVMIDSGFKITRVNPEFTNIFGYSPEEALGHEIKPLVTPDDLQDEADSFLPPEVAILGVSRSTMQPVWDGEQFQPTLMLPLSLSYDHRVIDGAYGVRFTTFLAKALSDVDSLLEAIP